MPAAPAFASRTVRPAHSTHMKKLPAILLCSLLLTSASIAVEAPTITISKTETIPVAVTTISGADGAAATRLLQNDLSLSGAFSVSAGTGANFTISGASSGGALQGKVVDAAGKAVLTKSYSGSARGKVHQFADDIVETITGRPGIATTKIAFVGTGTGRKEIYTADYDGSNVQRLTNDNSISVAPSLSSDGRRLAYTGYKSGYADIYEIDLGSGARNRIVKFPGTNSGPAYAPDGGRIACTLSKDGNPELYIVGSGGGGARRLTRTPGVESSPTWSPNGDELIYSSDDRGGPQLYRISAGGGGGRALSTGYTYCTEPNWSPDGRSVAFNVRQGGAFQVAIMDVNGGGARILTSGERPCWGRDSRHLLVAQGGGLYLVDAQTGKKTRIVEGAGKVTEPTWSR
jgi:TolB protein